MGYLAFIDKKLSLGGIKNQAELCTIPALAGPQPYTSIKEPDRINPMC